MTAVDIHTDDPLAPVREALVAAAVRDADRRLAAAVREAAAEVARAQQEAKALCAEARAQGAADARSVLVATRARSRLDSRTEVLRAQAQVRQELRQRVHEAVAGLRDDPAYPALLQHLEAWARAVLGPGADVRESPQGGVLAEESGRRFRCTLPEIADEALMRHETELARLWLR